MHRLYIFLYICGMKVLYCDIREFGEEFVEMCAGLLPEWRKEQMLNIKHVRGRVQCAVGWMLATLADEDKEDKRYDDKKDKMWRYNEHGKPYFEGRDDLFFSISHCGSAVVVAIDDGEVGVDIEEIGRYKERLENYVLNDDEVPCLEEARNDGERGEMFIELWTKKEAAFKLLGTGITHEIKDILKKADFNVYSQKIGDKYLSVASYKKLDDNDLIINDVTANVKNYVKIY